MSATAHRPVGRLIAAGRLLRWIVALGGMAGCAGKIPLPKHLEVSGAPELLARMEKAATPVRSYLAEARLTYLGPEGRVRGTASLAVARPDRLRYEILGPHGAVIDAFATNGLEFQALNMGQSRFIQGQATPDNLRRLLALAPLRLSPNGWVELLFGEVRPTASATVAYDDGEGMFVLRWREGDPGAAEAVVWVDPHTSRLVRAKVVDQGVLRSELVVEDRHGSGLPVAFTVAVPPAEVHLRVRLRDLELDPEALDDETVFVLDCPAGIVPENL